MGARTLKRAVELAGGQTAFARLIGVKQTHIWNWLNRDNRVPADKVLKVSEITGIPPKELRPDVFGQ